MTTLMGKSATEIIKLPRNLSENARRKGRLEIHPHAGLSDILEMSAQEYFLEYQKQVLRIRRNIRAHLVHSFL